MSTDSTPTSPVELEPLRPRVSTIIWGVILLGLATLAALGELGWLDELPNGALPIILVAGIGTLLVVAALIGALSSSRREPETGASTGTGTGTDPRTNLND